MACNEALLLTFQISASATKMFLKGIIYANLETLECQRGITDKNIKFHYKLVSDNTGIQ